MTIYMAWKDLNWSVPNSCLDNEVFTGQVRIVPHCQHCLSEDHTMHVQEVEKHTKLQAEDSMYWEREEVRGVYGAEGDDVVNVLVSCDGAWQKHGFLLFLELYSSSSLRPAR
jgi:hypothetical protein